MSIPPASAPPTPDGVRAAAAAVKAAIDRHLDAVVARSGQAGSGGDAAVQEAFDALQAAAETYDDLLFEVYEEVTPFESGAGDAAPEGMGDMDEAPPVVSVFLRRDYAVSDPDTLLEAGRAAHRALGAEGGRGDGGNGLVPGDEPAHHGAALFELLAVTGIDGFDENAEDAGLEPLCGTVWLLAGSEAARPDRNPFDDADPERLIFRVNEVIDGDDA